jgi:hypothetical protein
LDERAVYLPDSRRAERRKTAKVSGVRHDIRLSYFACFMERSMTVEITVSSGRSRTSSRMLCSARAEHFHWMNVPFIYRIHEEPNAEKLQKFLEFVTTLSAL